MENVELEIRISGLDGRRHRASVERGPSSVGGSRTFDLPEVAGVPAGAGDWRDLRRQAAPQDRSVFSILNDQGRALFDLVFAGEIYVAFLRSYELAREGGLWFRLQLSFDHAPQAIDLPWEALVFAREGNALALLDRVSIERRLIKAPSIEVPRVSADGRIRALIAGACPHGMDKISVEAERKWIKAALGKAVETRLLEHTSLSKLGKELADSAGFDLVHFLGHGDFETGEGGLWLEDERGDGVRLGSRELPATLRRPVSFVFLNVCHGGRSSANPFAGLAEALLRSGVRGVVAMRREISDKGAVALARQFYKCVAQGDTLTRALAKARQSVVDTHYGDWAVPMLYLAGEDFALLPHPLPIGVLLGPDLDPGETPEPGTDAVPAPRRALFESEKGKTPWTLKRIVALVLMILVAAFGMWFVWPSRSPGGDLPGPGPIPVPDPDIKTDPACPGPPDAGIQFALIPAGGFLQGNDKGKDEEKPAHLVELTAPYCLGRFEITRGQFAAVTQRKIPSPADDRLPAAEIRAAEVQEFLNVLNAADPEAKYRLPTEAQWEHAARAGTSSRYSFGEDEQQLFRYGNCLARDGSNDGYDSAAPVGTFEPNAWGLYDMHGNVWELVQDYWSYYTPGKAVDPSGPDRGVSWVRRGGAYNSAVENCRSSSRQDADPYRRQKTLGFRIVRTPLP